MFGFFRKKKDKDLVKVFLNGFSELLETQLILGGCQKQDRGLLLEDKFVLGYCWGMGHAMFRSFGLRDMTKCVAWTPIGIEYVFRGGANRLMGDVLGRSMHIQNDPEFLEGEMCGGNDYIDFIKNKTPTLKLAEHLLQKQK